MPKGKVSLDLDECERVLRAQGYEVVSNAGVLLVVRKDVEITLYPGGRLLMHPVGSKEQAEALAKTLFAALGK